MSVPDDANVHGLSYRHNSVDSSQSAFDDLPPQFVSIDSKLRYGLELLRHQPKELFPAAQRILKEEAPLDMSRQHYEPEFDDLTIRETPDEEDIPEEAAAFGGMDE